MASSAVDTCQKTIIQFNSSFIVRLRGADRQWLKLSWASDIRIPRRSPSSPTSGPVSARTDAVSPHIPDNLDAQLEVDCFREKHARVQGAIKQLGQVLRGADLDAIVIFGDDQHEQFNDDNMPRWPSTTARRWRCTSAPPGLGANFPELHLEKTASEYPNSAVAGQSPDQQSDRAGV